MKKSVFAFLLCTLSAAGLAAGGGAALAQTAGPQILLNWKAESYVPAGYGGKALPASDSAITVGVDLFDQNRRIDLSNQKIYWYLNGIYYQGAPGLTRINFTAPHHIGATAISVRVAIPEYGSGPGKTVTVPVVPPEVVVQTSSASLAALAAPFSLQAYPYFFNAKSPDDLQYSWFLRGALVGSRNLILVTQQMAQGGANAALELQVTNPNETIQRATRSFTLFSGR